MLGNALLNYGCEKLEVTIDSLEPLKGKIGKAVTSFKDSALYYADVRVEVSEGKGAAALRGNSKGAGEDFGIAIGTRVYARAAGSGGNAGGGRANVIAAGMCGRVLGKEQFASAEKQAADMLNISLARAKANLAHKQRLMKKYPVLGRSLTGGKLAETKAYVDTVKAKFKKNPRDMDLDEMIKRTEDISREVQKIAGIASNSIGMYTGIEREIFASSEGALIDQAKALAGAFVFVVAKGKAIETYHESMGNYLGTEVFEGETEHGKTVEQFAEFLAKGTVDLSNAPAMKTTENVTVITDPWYNALLSHEITGHPSEADRALKREAAWAGRAWWFNGVDDSKLGQKVASEHLSVFSDPTIQGYGKYKYDDEGVKAKKIFNIKKGVLTEFLNSRETAAILGVKPNGGMRATSADLMPIVRMNNTCFAPGKWKRDELFEETKEGYYAYGMKTPSIGETRQNFKITCWKLFKIEKGELTQLYRMGGITGDSYEFLTSIDAVADDFKLYNVPNCGKGAPMQVMKVGNGGPHLRAKATVSGAHTEGGK
ncbi:MAG: TldD/PmbA family protein [Candidatus Diapherotrites archaeon]